MEQDLLSFNFSCFIRIYKLALVISKYFHRYIISKFLFFIPNLITVFCAFLTINITYIFFSIFNDLFL